MKFLIVANYTKEASDAYFLETGKRPHSFQVSIDTEQESAKEYRKHFLDHNSYSRIDVTDIGELDSFEMPSDDLIYERWAAVQEELAKKRIDKIHHLMGSGSVVNGFTLDDTPLTGLSSTEALKEAIAMAKLNNELLIAKAREERERLYQENQARAERERIAAEEKKRADEEKLKSGPGIEVNGKRVGVITLPVELGATLQLGPVSGEKYWIAIIAPDPSSPGGLSREFCERSSGKYHHKIDKLVVGDAIEFGANEYHRKRGKTEHRWYGVVTRVTDTEIDVLGPMSSSAACKLDRVRIPEVYVVPDEMKSFGVEFTVGFVVLALNKEAAMEKIRAIEEKIVALKPYQVTPVYDAWYAKQEVAQ